MKKQEEKKEEGWSPLGALEVVLLLSEGKNFEVKEPYLQSALDFLSEKLSLSNVQVMLLAVLVNNEGYQTWGNLAKHFSSSLIKVRSYNREMMDLVKRRWVMRNYGSSTSSFMVVPEVAEALSEDRIYIPRPLTGRTNQQFLDEIKDMFSDYANMMNTEYARDLTEANQQLPICQLVGRLTEFHSYGIFFKVLHNYLVHHSDEDILGVHTGLDETAFTDLDFEEKCYLATLLVNGGHELFDLDLVEHKCVDGIADTSLMVLTDAVKETLADYKFRKPRHKNIFPKGYVRYKSIKEKSLFYNPEDARQLDMLSDLLSREQFPKIQQRLQEKGFRKGVACLLHGYPGTGKTASVYEIARRTGRDVMTVDIASMRDKYVGESEKAIKGVFSRYREMCECSSVTPILLFNEADALINKRLENVDHSVDKMENSMQNIILQEMENLDGILMATTNLISNLDDAFDRRFLFKIELHKPEVGVKAQIWKSLIPELSDADAQHLAAGYDFSGGQIENIARKQNIEYVIKGRMPSVQEIDFFCQNEILKRKNTLKPVVGFTHLKSAV